MRAKNWAAAVGGSVAAVAAYDLIQKKRAILRNYPVIGHMRYLLQDIRPEIQQYFIESNTDGTPFDRETRDMVYERAKGTKSDEPFGTERDVNALGYEFVRHSMRARFASDVAPKVRLGGTDCVNAASPGPGWTRGWAGSRRTSTFAPCR